MRSFYSRLSVRVISRLLACVVVLGSTQLRAQQANLVCNTNTPLVSTTAITPTTPGSFASLSVTSSTVFGTDEFANKENLIDASLSNAATWTFAIAGSAFIEVKDNSATTTNVYPAGSFAGFVINDNALSVFGDVTISTYRSTSLVESKSTNSLVSTGLGGGVAKVGFITTQNFDRVRITFTAVGGGFVNVHYAVVQKFCANSAGLVCNAKTPIVNPAFPAAINPDRTGTSGITVISINNTDRVVDSDLTNFATITSVASLLGSAQLSVKDQITNYPAGTFAGFDIETNVVVGVGILNNITINTYKDGGASPVQTVTGSSLLVSAPLLSSTGRQTIGFVANAEFDEVQIIINQPLNVNVGTTRIYNAVFKTFCNGPDLACNTTTILDESVYPVLVNLANTGLGGVACAGCSIQNTGDVIDASASTAARINLLTSVGSTASLAVKNQLLDYPAGTFAGFDVETRTLLSTDLLGSVTITLYNNGTAVQSGTGSNLILGATSSALTGNTRQIIGISSTVPAFDEIKITFERLAGIDIGTTFVYSATIQRSCEGALACNTTFFLKNPEFPSVINSARTGVTGGVCVACAVENPGNLVNSSLTDFATLRTTVGAVTQTSISVQDPVGTYPAGSYAGFVIKRNNFQPLTIAVDLFSAITITTYNDGVVQEIKTIGNLLDLTLLFNIFGAGNLSTFNIGFETTRPFDEMQLSVGAIASGLDQFVDVYSAFIDTRTAFGANLLCFKENPDFAVTLKNVPVSGSVKTNDIVGAGTTYGAPVGPVSSPAGSMPVLTVNVDGTYTFSSATPGVYVYQVTVCPPSQTTACPTSLFTITVLDPTVLTNPPVANVDYASVQGSITSPGSVTVDVDANDGPGNSGGTLTTPTIVSTPTNGTASIDPATGKLIYTPTAGYFGVDRLTYQVCESPGGLCATAQVTLTVNAPGSSTVTTIDDYASTAQNISVTGNVLTNDLGTNLTVSNPGSVAVPGKGTLVLTSTGSYTFTPVTDVTGPVDFTYTACDNSASAVCGTATLHLLVVPTPDLTPVVFVRPSTVNGTTSIAVVVDVFETKSAPTNRLITVKITKDASYILSFDQMATSVNGRSVQNSAWSYQGLVGGSYTFTTTNVIAGNMGTGKLSFGMTGTLTPGATNGVVTLTSVIVGGSGGETNISNNSDADKINYFQQ